MTPPTLTPKPTGSPVPIYPDGIKGRGFRCTDGSAAHQIEKLRIEG